MNDKTLPPEPPKFGETDARLDSFLQRAAPVIAEERGFNPRSRVKLESIAADMRLPEDLYNQAIHMLQGAPPVATKPTSRWVEAFRQYFHAKLEQADQPIVDAKLEARALEVAATKFQITKEQAQETIREVVKARGVRRISQSEAERHVTDLIREKVGDAAWLDDATTARLHAAGRQWGLSATQIGAIIRRFTSENRQRQKRERRTVVLFLSAAGLVVAAVIAFFVYISLDEEEITVTGPPDRPNIGAEHRLPDTTEGRRDFKPPAWWEDVGLAALAVQARLEIPSFDEYYYQLGSPESGERTEAYAGLLRVYEDSVENRNHRELLRELLAAIHAGEPDDEAAKRLRESLLELAIVDINELVDSSRRYVVAFAAVKDAVSMFDNGRLSGQRAQELELAIGRVTGASADRRVQRITIQRRCVWHVARRFYLQLIERGPAEPLLAADLYARLYELSAPYAVNAEELATLEARLLAAVVPAAGQDWVRFQPLIERCIASKDPLNVLKVVEVFERSPHEDLQVFIVERLLPQVRARPESGSVEHVAAAVREALGVRPQAPPKTARQRWNMLKAKVQSSPASSTDTEQLLKDTVNMAYLATLACALAQHDPGFVVFDQMVEEGPPQGSREEERTPADRRMSRGIADAAKRQDLDERIARLKEFSKYKLPQRTTDIRALARLVEYIDDINRDQAAAVASYLLADKTENYEHERIVEAIPPLRRWTHLLIALADEMPRATLPKRQVQELLAALLVRDDVKLDESSNWQRFTSNMLLQHALYDLTDRHGTTANPAKVLDDAELSLMQLYQTRGALLEAATHTAERPSRMLESLLERTTAKLGSGSLPAADRRWLENMPHRKVVIEYLGPDDLRRTVFMQREWLHALAIDISRTDSERGGRARDLVRELEQQDAQATDVLEQLLSGEVTTLKMWMLFAPSL